MGFARDQSAQLSQEATYQPQKHADSIGPASSIPNMRSVLVLFLQPLLSLFLQPWRQREEGKGWQFSV